VFSVEHVLSGWFKVCRVGRQQNQDLFVLVWSAAVAVCGTATFVNCICVHVLESKGSSRSFFFFFFFFFFFSLFCCSRFDLVRELRVN
jgi:hypothetical protein